MNITYINKIERGADVKSNIAKQVIVDGFTAETHATTTQESFKFQGGKHE